MSDWEAMAWPEVAAVDRGKAVALLPVGATEAHGPHLPLATDVLIALAMAREASHRLRAGGVPALVLPPLSYSVAGFAQAFPGTVSIRPETATALVADVATALATQGFRRMGIANAHLDPGHLASLHAAVERIRADGRIAVAFPDITRKPHAARLTDEFRSGACHAGRFEGSVVLAERPEWVREAIRSALPANPASLSVAIREGKSSFEGAGGPQAYFGDPASATAEEGRRTIDALGAILEEAVLTL